MLSTILRMCLLLVTLLAAGTAAAQSVADVDENIIVQISLAKSQPAFHFGETIPIRISFSSSVPNHYQLNMAQYDRSGRMAYERFVISPAGGAVDPLPNHTGGMGGLTSSQYLKSEPWEITLNLNEWIRFTQPGTYRLTVFSNRVSVKSGRTFGSPVVARSNEIRINIVTPSPEWQKQTLDDALKVLNLPHLRTSMGPVNDQGARRKAAETLRFLGTADAAREMAKRAGMDDNEEGLQYIYQLGLISSPERQVARDAMDLGLADPDRPIDSNFLYILRALNIEPGAPASDWKRAQREALEKLLAVLPNKRGKALTVSLSAAVNEAWSGQDLPSELMDKLVGQLISAFDQLPLNEQNMLLDSRWEKIKSPALIPLLKRRAEFFRDFSNRRESNAYDSLRLSANALRHWYEMDPAGARPAIINEIMRPRPRYDARVLGILPDQTLPEVDLALAEHLADPDLDAADNAASLIERYATDSILPQVLDELDAHVGRWACAIQEPILAYVLRVNPATARSRIEKAVAARGERFSACNHSLFNEVAKLHSDPVLEEIAIRSLDDPDTQVAISAASMLGRFGSPAAEPALWTRYEKWALRWSGHESQLDVNAVDGLNERLYQKHLGETLMRGLATGQSWLSDQTKLQKISRLTTVPALREELERYQKAWDAQPFTIDVQKTSSYFWARVAQYELTSPEALSDKLKQFPAGTKFVLGNARPESRAGEVSIKEVRDLLKAQRMVIVNEPE